MDAEMAQRLAVLAPIGIALLFMFVPSLREFGFGALRASEPVALPPDPETGELGLEFELVTLLGFDSIPAILHPVFVEPPEAGRWMDDDEQVLGLSINGEHRAYSIRMLSRHEIVNDVVGGQPVAVTW